mmetsp:Transcript_4034/g.6217  ORF Transcript_4034/g.6217 Transcript_4034/m.6217 type:complete len:210 (-) Transcript_4034:3475-4104(-)
MLSQKVEFAKRSFMQRRPYRCHDCRRQSNSADRHNRCCKTLTHAVQQLLNKTLFVNVARQRHRERDNRNDPFFDLEQNISVTEAEAKCAQNDVRIDVACSPKATEERNGFVVMQNSDALHPHPVASSPPHDVSSQLKNRCSPGREQLSNVEPHATDHRSLGSQTSEPKKDTCCLSKRKPCRKEEDIYTLGSEMMEETFGFEFIDVPRTE